MYFGWVRNEEVYDAIAKLRRTGQPGVLATVVGIKGSSPGALGSKMLVTPGPDGKAVGTVGGGCVDGHVYAEMAEVLRDGLPRSFTVDLTANDDPDHGLASIEALFAAYHLMGRPTDGLLDHYRWAEQFLAANSDLL